MDAQPVLRRPDRLITVDVGAQRPDDDWTHRSRDENAAILARLGLTGPFWQLP